MKGRPASTIRSITRSTSSSRRQRNSITSRSTREGDRTLHVATFAAEIGKGALVNDFTFTAGGAVTRNQIAMRMNGTNIHAGIRGATLLKGRQHADNTLVVDHAIGHCESRELFKAVLDGESRSVFQGKIIVQPHAQKTDAKMATHALLLSEEAEADAKPELEIFADDVVCGHGATAGALDDDLLFYLKARGIPQKEAEALMIEAFIGEAVEAIENEALREVLMELARTWLAARAVMHPAVTNGSYDVARIRQDFPALSMQVYGKPLVYLDNAASAQKPNGRARSHPARLHARICQRASWPALSRQCRDRRL